MAIPKKDPFLNALHGPALRRFPPFSAFGHFYKKIVNCKNGTSITAKILRKTPAWDNPKRPIMVVEIWLLAMPSYGRKRRPWAWPEEWRRKPDQLSRNPDGGKGVRRAVRRRLYPD